MTTELRPQITDYSHLEPLPDPPRREPDMLQSRRIDDFRATLRVHLAHRNDVLISGDGYLRREAGDDSEIFVPDCVVAFGVNPRGIIARNGYVINEVGKPPDFVLEVASRSTGRRDYTVKRDGYAGYGVQEYWRFDYTGGRYHDAPLAGDTLVEGQRYRPLPIHRDADGLLWGYSEVLDVELCWDAGDLWFRNHNTKLFLPAPEDVEQLREEEQRRREEEQRLREEEQRRREEEQRRREAAERSREDERHLREAAEERVRQLEAELRRRDAVQDT